MVDLSDISTLKQFFQYMMDNKESVHIVFHGLDKNSIQGIVVKAADDFVEIRYRYSQFLCPYNSIRLVTITE